MSILRKYIKLIEDMNEAVDPRFYDTTQPLGGGSISPGAGPNPDSTVDYVARKPADMSWKDAYYAAGLDKRFSGSGANPGVRSSTALMNLLAASVTRSVVTAGNIRAWAPTLTTWNSTGGGTPSGTVPGSSTVISNANELLFYYSRLTLPERTAFNTAFATSYGTTI